MKVKGRMVLVTGAGSGIGEQLCFQLLQKESQKIFALDIKENFLSDIQDSRLVRLKVDLTNKDDLQRVFESIGDIDILINCAGMGLGANFEDHSEDHFRKIMELNYFAPLQLIRNFYPRMKKKKQGQIVNISSLAGLLPLPGESAYVASKYALRGLSETLEVEGKMHNIQVTTVWPGVVQTPIYQTGQVIGYSKQKILEMWPKGVTSRRCAREIIREIESDTGLFSVTWFARFMHFFHRMNPRINKWFLARYFKTLNSKARIEETHYV